MEYILTVRMDSRYSETDARDIEEMVRKIHEYAMIVKYENNTSAKHLGLHVTMGQITVEVGEKEEV